MKNNIMLSVRSNCNFSLDYTKGTLHSQAEIIIITSAPKYSINKKQNELTKDLEISEYRFLSNLEGLNKLIGELQLVVSNITHFDQMASSLNVIIESSKSKND